MNSPFIKGSSWSSTSGRGNSNFCLTRSSACGHRFFEEKWRKDYFNISFSPLHFGWVPSRPSCATRCRSGSLWLGKQQPCLRKRKLGLDTTNNVFILQKAISFVPSVVLPRPAWQEKAHCVAAGSFFFIIFIFIIVYVYYSYAGSFCHIYYFLCLLFSCWLLILTLLFWQAWPLCMCWSFHVS